MLDCPGVLSVITGPYRRKAGVSESEGRRCEDRSAGQSDAIVGSGPEPQSQRSRWPPETEKGKEWLLHRSLQKDESPADTWILAPQAPFWTSDVWCAETIKLHCFKLLSCGNLLPQQ